MPLDQAVLDHQVVAKEQGPDGDKHMDVVAVAARRDMVTSLLGALRKAGLRPLGIDLSAFGMIRALGNGSATAAGGRHRPDDALLPPRRHHQPRRRPRPAVPVHAHRALRDREHRRPASPRRPRCRSSEAREWLVEVGLEDDIDVFDTDRDRGPGAPARRSRTAPRSWSTSCASRSSSTAPRRAPRRSSGSSSAGRAAPSPACRIAFRAASGSASSRSARRPSASSTPRTPPGSPSPTDSPWTARGRRCVRQPDPRRGPPWRPHPDAHRRHLLRAAGGAGARPARDHRRRPDQQADLRPRVRGDAPAGRAGGGDGQGRQPARVRGLPGGSAEPRDARSRASPRAASTGSAC